MHARAFRPDPEADRTEMEIGVQKRTVKGSLRVHRDRKKELKRTVRNSSRINGQMEFQLR
jgi:hypothetical protein